MESLIFVANGMYVASYFMRDILRLRLLTIAAASCLAIYFASLPAPMWTVVGWNGFFICLNIVQIGREIRARGLLNRFRTGRRRRSGAASAG